MFGEPFPKTRLAFELRVNYCKILNNTFFSFLVFFVHEGGVERRRKEAEPAGSKCHKLCAFDCLNLLCGVKCV